MTDWSALWSLICILSSGYLHEAFAPSTLSNWVLAGVGFFGVLAAVCTLRTIRRQTIATETAANAAKTSADAIITGDRPWLLVEKVDVGDKIQSPYLVPVEVNRERLTHCVFFIKNYGKTPAKMLAEKAELQMSEKPASPPDASIYRMDQVREHPSVFPQGEHFAVEAILTQSGIINQADRNAILGGTKFLWLCGCMRYRDTFERENAVDYETCFCYLYETRIKTLEPFWRPFGPHEYNRAS